MFTVTHGPYTYIVGFTHATQFGKYPRLGPYKGPKEGRRGPSAITTCTVLRQGEDGLRFVSQGLAVCTPADNFSRATSRKISFEKALQGRSLRREGLLEVLTAAYAAYAPQHPKVKVAKPAVQWNRETRTLEVLHA